MIIDVNAFVGAYPFRRVPATAPDGLLAAMDRVGIDQAWVSHLPGIFWRDPMEGNDWLWDTGCAHDRLRPVPAIHPGLAGWEGELERAMARTVPAVRCDPTYYGLDPYGPELVALAVACGSSGVPLMLSVRLEDGRQRHPHDSATELPAAAVRHLVRSAPDVRLLVTHADRFFIEEVHFGATPQEAARMWWDISWIWGPPEDQLQQLLGTIGIERFVFGTGQPLRLPEASIAKVDLLDLSESDRVLLQSQNALTRLGPAP
jgi:predicted TIM-barrel fold metal-dependent hydrolase